MGTLWNYHDVLYLVDSAGPKGDNQSPPAAADTCRLETAFSSRIIMRRHKSHQVWRVDLYVIGIPEHSALILSLCAHQLLLSGFKDKHMHDERRNRTARGESVLSCESTGQLKVDAFILGKSSFGSYLFKKYLHFLTPNVKNWLYVWSSIPAEAGNSKGLSDDHMPVKHISFNNSTSGRLEYSRWWGLGALSSDQEHIHDIVLLVSWKIWCTGGLTTKHSAEKISTKIHCDSGMILIGL